jgi:hypothetical protein
VRKCRTDFAAEIDINPRQLRPVEGLSRAHCAVGTITYRGGVKGTILYFKTTMTGDEPADIEGYRQRNPAFPQQSTADQFFSESQFESYRRLGLHCVESAIDPVKLPLDKTFERLSVRWQTPPGTPESASTQHAGAYSKLLDQWAKTAGLETHDAEFVPDVPPGFESGPARAQLFFILDLLQFMDNVFVDCHFGQSENRDHPSNEGWMNIFRHWARQQPVQKVWQGQRENFRGAFRYFMDDLISESRNGQHRTICR